MDDMDMYDTDGFETPESKQSAGEITVIQKGMIIELDINGKKLDVVNPEYVRELQRLISSMDSRIRIQDRMIRMMEQRFAKQDRAMTDLRSQLDGKIDRE